MHVFDIDRISKALMIELSNKNNNNRRNKYELYIRFCKLS
jgi:hypothetical protein